MTELVYCVTVAFTNLLPFNSDFSFGKNISHRNPNLRCRGADRPGLCDALPKKKLHESCGMARRIVVTKLICSLGQTWLVLETFKMAGYFLDMAHIIMYSVTNTFIKSN